MYHMCMSKDIIASDTILTKNEIAQIGDIKKITKYLDIDDVQNIKAYLLQGGLYSKIAENMGLKPLQLQYILYNEENKLNRLITEWRIKGMLKRAENVSDKIMTYEPIKNDGSINEQLLTIQQREAAYLRDRLLIARDVYDTKAVAQNNVIIPVPILQGFIDNNVKDVLQVEPIEEN